MEWLTLDHVAYLLRLPKPYVRLLTKQGFLVTIGKGDKTRWLNPTDEYKEKLRLAAILHNDMQFVPADISEIALLTLREVAVICGWTLGYARLYMSQNPQIPRFKINPRIYLYSIRTVRDILWRRQGRIHSHQRSPFLITELIDFVRKQIEEETRDTPTDAEYAADDRIQRKLEAIVRRSEKGQDAAKEDFADKVELARKVVRLLESAKITLRPGPSDPSACDAQIKPNTPRPATAEPQR